MGLRSRRQPERWFFVHLQKTAGTSLRAEFMRAFPGPALYPNPDDGDPVRDAPQLAIQPLIDTVADPNRRRRLRMVIGHFPLATVGLLDADFVTLTVLREPVERTLSYLRHYLTRHPELADRSLTDVYDDPYVFRSQIHNHMTKMLGMSTAEMSAGMLTELTCTTAHLEAAQQGLDAMGAFGLSEELPAFRRRLHQLYGWDLGKSLRINPTAPRPVPGNLLDRIRADNELDVQLYDYARARLAQR